MSYKWDFSWGVCGGGAEWHTGDAAGQVEGGEVMATCDVAAGRRRQAHRLTDETRSTERRLAVGVHDEEVTRFDRP